MKRKKIFKKIVFLLLFSFAMTGCSLIPRLTFDTKNTVPQSLDRSKVKDVCKGEAKFNENGDMIYCSKGYYAYSENYVKKERKMTIVERIKSFINELLGWGFWGLLLLVILVPGLAGTIIGRIIEGTIGITGKSLKAIVKGVQNTRKTGKNLEDSLSAESDSDVKKHIRKLKEKENIK